MKLRLRYALTLSSLLCLLLTGAASADAGAHVGVVTSNTPLYRYQVPGANRPLRVQTGCRLTFSSVNTPGRFAHDAARHSITVSARYGVNGTLTGSLNACKTLVVGTPVDYYVQLNAVTSFNRR